jgi:hypothetical protein
MVRLIPVLFCGSMLAFVGTALHAAECISAACAQDPEYDRIREYERGVIGSPAPRATIAAPMCADSACNEADPYAADVRELERGNEPGGGSLRRADPASVPPAAVARTVRAPALAQPIAMPMRQDGAGWDWFWRVLAGASGVLAAVLLVRWVRRHW